MSDGASDTARGRLAATIETIERAYERSLTDGKKTKDLGGDLGTDAFTEAVIERLRG